MCAEGHFGKIGVGIGKIWVLENKMLALNWVYGYIINIDVTSSRKDQ